ncbi:hypothetical protein EmuJ_000286500 [Echinococcus multilocularis]|uniref:Hypothetical transcript n=1 Tax=Echinococcus multilocularis TaxID=6211 RepID=A0A068XZ25_ECHMU|nr:hypothetical transcript [Echinococcus multilocularis]CDS36113.1 hypothetical protein EmuJ_000286500 [Echinococcus multilocularis]
MGVGMWTDALVGLLHFNSHLVSSGRVVPLDTVADAIPVSLTTGYRLFSAIAAYGISVAHSSLRAAKECHDVLSSFSRLALLSPCPMSGEHSTSVYSCSAAIISEYPILLSTCHYQYVQCCLTLYTSRLHQVIPNIAWLNLNENGWRMFFILEIFALVVS